MATKVTEKLTGADYKGPAISARRNKIQVSGGI